MEEERGGDCIEEGSASVSLSVSGGGESRWVDGSEMEDSSESTAPPWSAIDGGGDGGESDRDGCGSLRRRFVKKPERADSLDVEAMEIQGVRRHHSKVVA